MEIFNESGQAKARTTSQESSGCNDSDQSEVMGAVRGSSQANEQGSLGYHRAIDSGFFAGGGSIDEAILIQLLEVANKGLKNARACIEWYEEEEKEYLKQTEQLKELLKIEREKREYQSSSEEEE